MLKRVFLHVIHEVYIYQYNIHIYTEYISILALRGVTKCTLSSRSERPTIYLGFYQAAPSFQEGRALASERPACFHVEDISGHFAIRESAARGSARTLLPPATRPYVAHPADIEWKQRLSMAQAVDGVSRTALSYPAPRLLEESERFCCRVPTIDSVLCGYG